MYGRQLEDKDILYSLISRKSIDTLKEFYRDEVTKDEWALSFPRGPDLTRSARSFGSMNEL
jgi:hypothetical protein